MPEIPVRVIRAHPLYPDDASKQARLEHMIDNGFITRIIHEKSFLIPEPHAEYSLTNRGAAVWELEALHEEFFSKGMKA